jgi:hypothetical protein
VKKKKMKTKTNVDTKVKGIVISAVIIASMFALSAPAAASYTYDGYEVKTMTNGIVQGDVFVSCGNNAGAADGRIDPGYNGPYRTNYSVPNGDSVKWARLVVGVWGGTENNSGWLNTTLNASGTMHYLGNVSIGNCSTTSADDDNPTYSQTQPGVYGTGHGVWLVAYNVTNNVSLNAWNNVTATTYRCWPPYDFDGRIYGIVLVVVYENDSLPKVKYWVNEGNVNLHYNMTNPPYNYCLDNTTTWFNGTAYNSTEAKLWVEYLASSRGEPDYLYFNPPNEVQTNMSWNRSAYYHWQLDLNDVANESTYNDAFTYGFDLHNYTSTNDSTPLKDIVNYTANNSAFFWRGHDDNGDGWIYANFSAPPEDVEEGEDYLHPVLAVLILKNITHVYDFSDNFSGTPGVDAWAFKYQVGNDPGAGDPGIEFNATEYAAIKADDGVFACNTTTTNGCYAAHRFNFSIDEAAADIDKINVTWNGKGWHDSGDAYNGTYLYIYNFTSGSYGSALASTDSGTEVTLTGEKTSGISNYINAGNVTILAKQKSPQSGLGTKYRSHICTDYIRLVITDP